MGQDLLLAIKVIQWADPIKNGRTVQKCKYSKFDIFSSIIPSSFIPLNRRVRAKSM